MSQRIGLLVLFLFLTGCTYAAYGVKTPYGEIERLEGEMKEGKEECVCDCACECEEEKKEAGLLCRHDQWTEGCV